MRSRRAAMDGSYGCYGCFFSYHMQSAFAWEVNFTPCKYLIYFLTFN